MGLGFGLLLFFTLPLTLVFALGWLMSGKASWGKALAVVWSPVALLVLIDVVVSPFFSKMQLDQDDVYGHYVIDRSKYPGRQADWQYDHFRFEITPQHDFLFYQTEQEKIIRTFKGKISFAGGSYVSPRIVLHLDTPAHHILQDNPTLYRDIWSFYYVFRSPLFGNVFFKKGKWKPLQQ